MTLTGIRKHVDVLEAAGLVTTEKVGRVRQVRLGTERLDDAMAWISFYQRLWERRLDGLEAYFTLHGTRRTKRRERNHERHSTRARRIGLRMTRQLPATPEEVFDAYTDAEKQKIWFSILDEEPGIVEIEVDLRVGGKQIAVWGPEPRHAVPRGADVPRDRPPAPARHRVDGQRPERPDDDDARRRSRSRPSTAAPSSPSSRPASRPPRSATSSRPWSGSARSTASRRTSRAPDRVRGESVRLAATRGVRAVRPAARASDSRSMTGTRSILIPFGLLSVLDVRQHQSNARAAGS